MNSLSSYFQQQGYQLQQKLAEGGMAAIYLGKQISLDRTVAVKILSNKLLDDEEVLACFEAEAVIIARLNHPNIVHVIDKGISDTGLPFFVMEYVKGVNLAKAIQLNRLSLQQKFKLALQICQAIEYAHRNQVIHRDIKPDNILVDMEGNALVLDFGIAVLEPELQQQQLVAGTAKYMAPELMQGQEQANQRTDIFSLGVVLYELFGGLICNQQDYVAYQNLSERNSQLPPALDELIKRCLASDSFKRPASVQAVYSELLEISHGSHLAQQQKERAGQVVGQRAFVLLDVLRESELSSVYLFEEKQHHNLVVVKKYNNSIDGYIENKKLQSVRHKNIMPVMGVNQNQRCWILVNPYMPGGTLKDRLVKNYNIEKFLSVARQIVEAMNFSHQNAVCHGAVRSECIFFDETDQVQISGFGINKHSHEPRVKKEIEVKNQDLVNTGEVFYQMLIGRLPQWKSQKIIYDSGFKKIPESVQNLLNRMLMANSDSKHRFDNFQQVLNYLDGLNESLATEVLTLKVEGQSLVEGIKGGFWRRHTNKILLAILLVALFVVMNGLFWESYF